MTRLPDFNFLKVFPMGKKKLGYFTLLSVFTVLLAACGGNSAQNKIAIGNPAPDFTLTSSDSTQVSLSDYKGEPVLLFFHMAGG